MTFATLVALAAAEEHHGNAQMETIGFGITAMVVFISLAIVTVSFRNVANRHSPKAEKFAERHGAELEHSGGHH